MVQVEDLRIDAELHHFLVKEALPGSGIDPSDFWRGLSRLFREFSDRNKELLARRAELQALIDEWHRDHRGQYRDVVAYRAFLEEIGYLSSEPTETQVTTTGVDLEVAEVAGPQLIVPVTNARYALNAANARWGSLYDALYGTDALGEPPPPGPYDEGRGAQVISWVRNFLDATAPLGVGSHTDVVLYEVAKGQLQARLSDGRKTRLGDAALFAGFRGDASTPESILLRHHGLHVELVIDRTHQVGSTDRAGIADVLVEAAVTTIVDCEDSVAAVDASDKVHVYRNWLGLMKGDLTDTFSKSGQETTRRLADEKEFVSPTGTPFRLPGCALLMVRTVGHLMTTDAVRRPARCHRHRAGGPAQSRQTGRAAELSLRVNLRREAQDARSRRGGIC
jgi:malate synthase